MAFLVKDPASTQALHTCSPPTLASACPSLQFLGPTQVYRLFLPTLLLPETQPRPLLLQDALCLPSRRTDFSEPPWPWATSSQYLPEAPWELTRSRVQLQPLSTSGLGGEVGGGRERNMVGGAGCLLRPSRTPAFLATQSDGPQPCLRLPAPSPSVRSGVRWQGDRGEEGQSFTLPALSTLGPAGRDERFPPQGTMGRW